MHSRRLVAGLSLLAICSVIPAGAANAAGKPNIIVIVGDDMGYADLGVQGCRDIPTPHLDALAADGVRFTNGYVSGPYCSPTRAGLLTGRYQTRFGHEFNPGGMGSGAKGMPLSETTLADRLKAAGYATGLVGKWHLGNGAKFHPQQRGFDEFFGFLAGGHSYFPGEGAPIYHGEQPVDEQEYLTDAFAREAADFVDRHRESPFFLYLAFNAVHTPMHADDARVKRFASITNEKRRTYAAMMAAMDDGIGQVLAKLEECGLEDDTLVFFFSDNGGPTMRGTTTNGSINAPLRGSKRTTLEGGVRVPFFVKWPGEVPAGKIYDKPVIQLDVMPTALAAAGVEVSPDWKVEGVDLSPFLTGSDERAPHDQLCWRFGEQMAIRRGDWKLVKYDSAVDGEKGRATPARLYNLADDMGEEHDVLAEHPEKVRELQAAWDEWNKDNVPPEWGGAHLKGKGKGKGKRRAAENAAG